MKRTIKSAVPVVLLAAIAMLLGGCYERVVSARGFGSERIQIEEPYQESGQLDRWIFGEDPTSKSANNFNR